MESDRVEWLTFWVCEMDHFTAVHEEVHLFDGRDGVNSETLESILETLIIGCRGLVHDLLLPAINRTASVAQHHPHIASRPTTKRLRDAKLNRTRERKTSGYRLVRLK